MKKYSFLSLTLLLLTGLVLFSANQVLATPAMPTSLTSSCPTPPGTTGILNWNAVSGATFYSVYAQTTDHTFNWKKACDAPHFCQRVYSPSTSFTTISGATYQWYVAAGDNTGESDVAGATFTCTPTPTSTPTPTPTPTPAQADVNCPYGTTQPIRLNNGLLSTIKNSAQAGSIFSTTNLCITDTRAAIPQFSIPTYAEMKSVYYDKSKLSKIPIANEKDIKMSANDQKLFSITGNLILSKDIKVQKDAIAVIFVNGNLDINDNQTFNNPNNSGLVFVVSGNVNVAPNVTEINAFIITYGTFCSSWNGSSCLTSDNRLTINGSVISLDAGEPPKFVRSLPDNTTAAEIVQYQPKYLVILKNIFSKTLTIWKEIQ